jgi:hypothetical protein
VPKLYIGLNYFLQWHLSIYLYPGLEGSRIILGHIRPDPIEILWESRNFSYSNYNPRLPNKLAQIC